MTTEFNSNLFQVNSSIPGSVQQGVQQQDDLPGVCPTCENNPFMLPETVDSWNFSCRPPGDNSPVDAQGFFQSFMQVISYFMTMLCSLLPNLLGLQQPQQQGIGSANGLGIDNGSELGNGNVDGAGDGVTGAGTEEEVAETPAETPEETPANTRTPAQRWDDGNYSTRIPETDFFKSRVNDVFHELADTYSPSNPTRRQQLQDEYDITAVQLTTWREAEALIADAASVTRLKRYNDSVALIKSKISSKLLENYRDAFLNGELPQALWNQL